MAWTFPKNGARRISILMAALMWNGHGDAKTLSKHLEGIRYFLASVLLPNRDVLCGRLRCLEKGLAWA